MTLATSQRNDADVNTKTRGPKRSMTVAIAKYLMKRFESFPAAPERQVPDSNLTDVFLGKQQLERLQRNITDVSGIQCVTLPFTSMSFPNV